MSPARFLVSLIIFISFFILAVSAKGHHRQAPPSTGQPPNPVHKSPGTNVGAAPPATLPPPPGKPETPAMPSAAPVRKGVEAREFLKAHNVVRTEHNQTLYKWDKKLARFARRWGSTRAADCRMIHSMGPYGENMFWGKYDHWTPRDAVESWAVEHKDYNADTNECAPNKMCGHYTQIVWHESRLLGCSRIKCLNGGVVLICEYDPPGNYLGESPFGKVFDDAPPIPPPMNVTSTPSNSSPSTLPPPSQSAA